MTALRTFSKICVVDSNVTVGVYCDGIAQGLSPGSPVSIRALTESDNVIEFQALACIDTPKELMAFQHGAILPVVGGPVGG